MPESDDELLEVGHVIGVHGIRGQVKVFSNTSPRENIVTYSPWVVMHNGQQNTVEVKGGTQGKNIVAAIEGITDRNSAAELTGARIYIRKSQLPRLDKGDFYWSELTGLEVVSTQDISFGAVDHMIETGANDVMVVQGDRERLIPYVMDEVIKSIDLQKKRIVVDWDANF